jgi:hypothetical protein
MRSMNEGLLMNVEIVRRRVMEYRGQEFQYELDNIDSETDSIRRQEIAKTYRRKRSLHSTRRRKSTAAASNHPGCGMGGRRNRRWSW